MSSNKKTIKKKSAYKSWLEIIKMAETFPMDKHIEELKTLHEQRSARMLVGSKLSAKKISEASSQDLHVRSRCVELLAISKRSRFSLERANEALRDYLFDRAYVDGKTQAEKVRSANHMLKKGLDLVNELEYFGDICDDYITDIDRGGYSLKLLFDSINLVSKGERVI